METNQPVPVPVVKKTFPFKPVLISVAVIVVLLLGFFGYKVFLNKDNGADQGGEIVWWGLWEDETTVKSLISDYETKNPKWWAVSVGKELNAITEYGEGTGQWKTADWR